MVDATDGPIKKNLSSEPNFMCTPTQTQAAHAHLMLSWGTPQGLVTSARVLSLTRDIRGETRVSKLTAVYMEVKIFTILCTWKFTINN